MYRFRRKIAAVLATVVMLTTNLGTQLLPQSIRSTAENYLSPVADAATSSIKATVNAGEQHSMAIKSDGTVVCWGENSNGELGTETKTNQYYPVTVKGIDNVVAVSATKNCSYAVKSDGTVWKWGMIEPYLPAGTPVKVEGLQDIVDIKAASDLWSNTIVFYLALKSDGTVWSWGDNSYGQLGIGSNINNYTPTQVPGLANVKAIAAGGKHSVALKSDGTVWCWGGNGDGQLGNNTTSSSNTPVCVSNLSDVTAVAADGYHTLALKSNGTVYAWGCTSDLGFGSSYKIPNQIAGLSGITKIATGENHCVAVKNDGTVWTLGKNTYGQCGNSSTSKVVSASMLSKDLISDITDISVTNYYNLAIKKDGSVYSWGKNQYQVLGKSSTSDYLYIPEAIERLNLFSTTQDKPEGVILNKTSLTKTVGESERLLATLTPSAVSDTGIKWYVTTSSEPLPVSVSADGLVTAVAPGKCVIRAESSTDNNKFADCTVEVKAAVKVAGLTLNKEDITIEREMSEQLTATIEPMNVSNKNIKWDVIEGSSMVSVANGRVTAYGSGTGTAVIRAASDEDSSICKYCKVTVNTPEDNENKVDIGTVDSSKSIYGKWNSSTDEDNYDFTVSKTGTYRISSQTDMGNLFLNSNMTLYELQQDSIAKTTIKSGQTLVFQADLTAGKKYNISIKSSTKDVCSYNLKFEYIKIPPTEITFSESVLLNKGETKQLIPNVKPLNAYSEFTWSIPEDDGIVAVSPSGVVTALKAGTAKVKATSVLNSTVWAYCTIRVDDYANTTTSAFEVQEDKPIYGEINPPKDVDCFVFTAQDTGVYSIDVTTESSLLSLKPWVTVYDKSGEISYEKDKFRQWNLVAGNTYYVELEGMTDYSVGSYKLDIRSLTVHVTGMTFPYYNDTAHIELGQEESLLANIQPSNATNKDVTWSLIDDTSNDSITISSIGYVMGLKVGQAKVRAISNEFSDINKDCTINVVSDFANSTNSALDIQNEYTISGKIDSANDPDYFKFIPSKSGIYNINLTPKDAEFYPSVYLRDSNGDIITSAYYKDIPLTAELLAGSTYYISVECNNMGNYSLKVEYTVVPVKGIALEKDNFVLEEGQITQASIIFSPAMVSKRNIIWTVPTGSGIVTVSTSGSIEAIKLGKAVVRATSEDNSTLYKDCAVKVNRANDHGEDIDSPYFISDNTTIQGIISPCGETDYFQFKASKTCYYKISAIANTSGSSLYYKTYTENGSELKPDLTYTDYILSKLNSGQTCNVKLGMLNSTEIGGYTFSVRPQITIATLSAFSILPGATTSLTAITLPSDEKVIWSVVSGNQFVSISGDNITGIKRGTATIRATSATDKTVYRECNVTVDYGTSIETAYKIEYNKSIRATFSSSTDYHYFKFTPPFNEEYLISAEYEKGGAIFVYLYDSNGKQLDWNANSLSYQLSIGSTYYIKLSPFEATGYVLKIGEPVDSVSISQTTAEMRKGQKLKLDATAAPSFAGNMFVNWSVVSGSSVVAVSQTGEVTALTTGSAIVRAASRANYSKYDQCYIKVTPVTVSGINLSTTSITMAPQEEKQLSAEVLPVGANQAVVWSTSDSGIISVSVNGKVKALKTGNAKVRVASAENLDIFAECNVTVNPITVASITISPTSITMTPQEEKQLTAEVLPIGANQAVVWSTSDSGIISVSESGKVKALAPGTAKVHVASAEDESKYAECDVTVQESSSDPGTGTQVAVSGINISPSSITMTLKQPRQLIAAVLPEDATNKEVVWSVTSGSSIVTVSAIGIVEALKQGNALVRAASSENSEVYKECAVTVLNDDYGNTTASAVTISESAIIAGSNELPYDSDMFKFAPSKTGIYKITLGTDPLSGEYFSIYDGINRILPKDNSIDIKLEANQTYYIEVRNSDESAGSYTLSITPVVKIEITLSPNIVSLFPGQVKQINVSITSPDSTAKQATWSVTSGSGIVSVSETGAVTAIEQGQAVVRATCEGQYKECTINVVRDDYASTTATAVSIGINDSINGTIQLPGDYDYFKFTPSTTGTYTISFSGGFDTALGIYNSNGKIVPKGEYGGDITVNLDAQNIYFIFVTDFESIANYTFKITPPAGSENAFISMQNADYKNADISVTITFNGNTLNGIYNGDKKLVEGQGYVLSDIVYGQDGTTTVSAICTIKNDYLKTLPKEQTTKLTFDFDKGNDSELTVAVPKLDECFIATAAFGSKLQPAVALLRQFRDQCLLTNWLGTKFVNFYYKNSPPIAQFIAGNDTLRGIVRGLLLPFIAIAYGIMHPVAGCLGLIVIILAAVLWRKRRRRLVNM